MTKKILLITSIIALFASCAAHNGSEQVTNSYLNALKKGEIEQAKKVSEPINDKALAANLDDILADESKSLQQNNFKVLDSNTENNLSLVIVQHTDKEGINYIRPYFSRRKGEYMSQRSRRIQKIKTRQKRYNWKVITSKYFSNLMISELSENEQEAARKIHNWYVKHNS